MPQQPTATRPPKRPRKAATAKPCETPLSDFKPTALLQRVTTMGLPGDDIAQSYMRFIVFRVSVILERRRWRVGTLKEFYPRGASLLGLNVERGQEVCVRFRVPGSRAQFLPFHEVMCTTLHELAHCVHSRHDKVFWSLYYDVVKECEALEVRMVEQGVPLYPPSAHAGAGSRSASGAVSGETRAPPASFGNTLANRHLITAGDAGHRLGGGTTIPRTDRSSDPEERRRVLAAAVALRRAQAQTSELPCTEATTTTSEPDSHSPDTVPTTPPEQRADGWSCPRCTFWNISTAGSDCAMCGDAAETDEEEADAENSVANGVPQRPKWESQELASSDAATQWACRRCTFLNPIDVPVCAMCEYPKDAPPSLPSGAHAESDDSVIIISGDDA